VRSLVRLGERCVGDGGCEVQKTSKQINER